MPATAPGPIPLSQLSSVGPNIQVYPADLFTSTQTPKPNVTAGPGTGGNNATTSPGTVQTGAEGGFYTQIQMVDPRQVLTGLTGSVSGSSGMANPQAGSSIYLPLPWKINDIEVHLWNDYSFIDQIPVLNEFAKLGDAIKRGAGSAQSVNPFLYMLYKQPAFREFELAWSFSPNNSSESQILCQILNYLKTGALPEYASGELAVLNYPWLALIRLNPNRFMFDFKPCAVTSVNIDFTGSGQGPAFFNDGAPAIINFTLGLKEVEIQVRSDTAWRAGSLTSGMTLGTGVPISA